MIRQRILGLYGSMLALLAFWVVYMGAISHKGPLYHRLPCVSHGDTAVFPQDLATAILRENGTARLYNPADEWAEPQLFTVSDADEMCSQWKRIGLSRTVLIYADGDASYGLVEDLIEPIRDSGVRSIVFMTQPKRSGVKS